MRCYRQVQDSRESIARAASRLALKTVHPWRAGDVRVLTLFLTCLADARAARRCAGRCAGRFGVDPGRRCARRAAPWHRSLRERPRSPSACSQSGAPTSTLRAGSTSGSARTDRPPCPRSGQRAGHGRTRQQRGTGASSADAHPQSHARRRLRPAALMIYARLRAGAGGDPARVSDVRGGPGGALTPGCRQAVPQADDSPGGVEVLTGIRPSWSGSAVSAQQLDQSLGQE